MWKCFAFREMQTSESFIFILYLSPDSLLHLCRTVEFSAVDFVVHCFSVRETVVLLSLTKIFYPYNEFNVSNLAVRAKAIIKLTVF
jgi:hypothetical protein